jgi:hypothetical protein
LKDNDVEHDPNINPIWDALVGTHTDTGTLRLLGIILIFIVAGGAFFWAIG